MSKSLLISSIVNKNAIGYIAKTTKGVSTFTVTGTTMTTRTIGGYSYVFIKTPSAVTSITCSNLGVEEIDISAMINLQKIYCHNNNIKKLEFSKNPKIQYIHCFDNPVVNDDTTLLELINSLPNRNNQAYGSLIINSVMGDRTQIDKVENLTIQKDWLFGSPVIYNSTEWAKCDVSIKQTGVADIWESAEYGSNIKVAMIDAGFSLNSQELRTDAVKEVRNFSNQGLETEVPLPTSGTGPYHGDATTSIVASKGVSMYGIAPKCDLYLYKAADATGVCYTNWVGNAIYHAVDDVGIDVMSMSMSFPSDNTYLKDAVDYAAADMQKTFICSAGNTGDGVATSDELRYPGSYKSSIAVAGINSSNGIYSWSSSYNGVNIATYGSVKAIYSYNSYKTFNGTSCSTPIVAGAVALLTKIYIKKNGRKPTKDEIYQELIKRTTAMNLDVRSVGVGRLNLMDYNSNPAVI